MKKKKVCVRERERKGESWNLEASNGLKAPQLLAEIGQTDGVVEDPTRTIVVGVGPTNDADQRQVLAVRSGDRVEHAEPANGERDNASADTSSTGVAIGSVPGVELVAAADDVERGLSDEVVEQSEVEVAGNGENIGDTDFNEAAREVAAESGVSAAVDDGGRNTGLYGSAVGLIARYDVVAGRLDNVQ